MEAFGLPIVLICIDASHIPIAAPNTNKAIYFNCKSYHSINVQAICGDVFKFIDVAMKCPGAERLFGGGNAARGRWGALRSFRKRNKDTTSCQNNDTIFLNIN